MRCLGWRQYKTLKLVPVPFILSILKLCRNCSSFELLVISTLLPDTTWDTSGIFSPMYSASGFSGDFYSCISACLLPVTSQMTSNPRFHATQIFLEAPKLSPLPSKVQLFQLFRILVTQKGWKLLCEGCLSISEDNCGCHSYEIQDDSIII